MVNVFLSTAVKAPLRIALLIVAQAMAAPVWAHTASQPESPGVADLRRALQSLRTSEPIVLDVQFKLFGRSGDDKDLQAREGLLQLQLEDSPSGLRMHYAPAVIHQLRDEELAKTVDEDVKNSALNAIGPFDYWEWRELVYPVDQLELMLARYHFVSESDSYYEAKPARLLRFSLPKEKIDKRYRKYVKKYRNRLNLWIDEQGVPLASQMTEAGTGRVFVVVGFQFKNQVKMEYQRVGNRLITRRREVNDESEGATMQSERHFISLVTPASE
jgi:hypothetical protein